MRAKYPIEQPESFPSPSLLVYQEVVKANIQHALDTISDPNRLRPHVKTHKTSEIVQLELAAGITKHKCATLREAQLLAEAGVRDIVIAYQLVGPNIPKFLTLKRKYPEAHFVPTVDHPQAADQLAEALAAEGMKARVLLDLDVGMHRTGIAPGPEAVELYRQIDRSTSLEPYGLHVYDGHIHDRGLAERKQACEQVLDQVDTFKALLRQEGHEAPIIVMGGTPTFPIYAAVPEVETSPGTFVLHDYNYTTWFPDLGFSPAAFLLSRVISTPEPGRATLDLGYKAISPDSKDVRGALWDIEGAQMEGQNEEHWMVRLPPAQQLALGQEVLVCPAHICPTVAMHDELYVLDEEGQWVDTWRVAARERGLSN